MDRDQILQLENDALIKLCDIDFFKATGPGGQKKNKTESAVRLTLKNSAISTTASEDRQQSINRSRALQKMRLAIALEMRQEPQPWTGQWDMNTKNSSYSLFAACLTDHLHSHNWQVSEAAKSLNLSTGKLIKIIAKNETFWQFLNSARQKNGYKPLKK